MRHIHVSLLFQICFLIICSSCDSNIKTKETSSSSKSEDSKKLQDRANVFLNNSNFNEAEELLKRAISLNSNSSLYVDIFRLYAIQDRFQEADESMKRALSFKQVDPSAYFLNGKYIFSKYNRDSIVSVLYNFKKASELGNNNGEDYYNAIQLIENYRKAFLSMEVNKLLELNFQDAMIDYYGSLNEAKIEISNIFTQFSKAELKLNNLEYFIPHQIFTTTNNSKLAKFRIMLSAKNNQDTIQMPDQLLLISINGTSWRLMSFEKSHKNFLSKYFGNDILDQVFK